MAADPATSSGGKKPGSSGLRQIILILILVVVGGALYYDRQVARPAAEAAHKLLEEKAIENVGSSSRPLSEKDVQEILGRTPSKTDDLEFKVVETYAWMAGVPWRSYYVTVVYSKTIGDLAFSAHYLNEPAPDESLRDRFDDESGGSEETSEDVESAGGPSGGGAASAGAMQAPDNPANPYDENGEPIKPAATPDGAPASEPAAEPTAEPTEGSEEPTK